MKGLKRLIPHRKKKENRGDDGGVPPDGTSDHHPPTVLEPLAAIPPDWAGIRPYEYDPHVDNRYSTGSPPTFDGIPPQDFEEEFDNRYSAEGPDFYDNLSSQEYRKRGSDVDRSISEKSDPNSKRVEISMPEQSFAMQRNGSKRRSVGSVHSEASVPNLDDDAPNIVMAYARVPQLELTKLPRGGVSMDTQAVGRVQVRRIAKFTNCVSFLLCVFSTYAFVSLH